MVVGILVAAVHAAVAVVVHTAVTHIQLVHHVYHTHYHLWVVCGVAVYLYIEYVSATCQVVVWSLNLSLVACRTLVVNGHVVRVCVIVAIGNTLNNAKLLTVNLCESSTKALGWCCQDTIVMQIFLREIVCTITHIGNYLHTKFLCLSTLTMMMSDKSLQTLCQTDEANT